MNISAIKLGGTYLMTNNHLVKVIAVDNNPVFCNVLVTGSYMETWVCSDDLTECVSSKSGGNPLKVLVLGYKQSGKDTAAEYWRDTFGMTFKSSSWAAGEIFIFDYLMYKYGYTSKEECFADRVHRRAEWYDLICDYNKYDPTRLAKEILTKTGAYIGMRSKEEVQACIEQKIFDLIIWIDAEKRVGKESSDSCTVTEEYADIIIDNNGTEKEFKDRLNNIGKIIFKKLV